MAKKYYVTLKLEEASILFALKNYQHSLKKNHELNFIMQFGLQRRAHKSAKNLILEPDDIFGLANI